MMSDCSSIGTLTNVEARETMTARIKAALLDSSGFSTIEVIWPNQKPPGLEGREDPFLLLTVVDVDREHMEMGFQGYISTKFLDISLWIREYTGIKLVDEFKDFVDPLGLTVTSGIDYGPVNPMKSLKHEGWEVHPMALPFRF